MTLHSCVYARVTLRACQRGGMVTVSASVLTMPRRWASTALTTTTTSVAPLRQHPRPNPYCTVHVSLSRSSLRAAAMIGIATTRGGYAPAMTTSLRSAANSARSGGKDIDIVDQEKPIHIRVAEQKDSQIYTYNEYLEKHEKENRASRSLAEAIDETRDNPIWMLWALLFLTLSVLTVVVSVRVRREQLRFDPKLRAVKSFDSPDGPSIGGPFTLKDVNTGKTVTEKDFLGKWLYIYFGFTNCPDVCPEEMAKMSRVIAHLDKKVGKDYWQPLFVSLDPKRDTPAKIREYLADFSPRILGLVGTPEQVEQAAREYRVYFAIPDEEAMSEEDYLVDHSIIMYLMDPAGKFSDYTTKEFQWFESYSKLLRRMMDYERDMAEDQQQRGGKLEPGERPANMAVAGVASMTDEAAKAAAAAWSNKPKMLSSLKGGEAGGEGSA